MPLPPAGAELLFEVFSRRSGRGSTIVTSNLRSEDRTSIPVSGRSTGGLVGRLTRHLRILTVNGNSYRLKQSSDRRRFAAAEAEAEKSQTHSETVDPDAGGMTEA